VESVKIYIVICHDHHTDEEIEVFISPDTAVEYAKDFVPKRYDFIEQELTEEKKKKNWVYLANYGVEGDCVRVEKSLLNE